MPDEAFLLGIEHAMRRRVIADEDVHEFDHQTTGRAVSWVLTVPHTGAVPDLGAEVEVLGKIMVVADRCAFRRVERRTKRLGPFRLWLRLVEPVRPTSARRQRSPFSMAAIIAGETDDRQLPTQLPR